MRQKSMSKNDPAESTVRDIRRKTRKQYTAEEKIRIVVSGLRGEERIACPSHLSRPVAKPPTRIVPRPPMEMRRDRPSTAPGGSRS